MPTELRQIFENSIGPERSNLEVLQERGLVRRDISDLELEDELSREAVVETAMARFVLRPKPERLEILAELGADNRYDQAMAADVMMQPVSDQQTTLNVLEEKAKGIWERTMDHIRSLSSDYASEVSAIEEKLSNHEFDAVRSFLADASDRTRELDEQFQSSFIEAKRKLRSEFSSEFGRFWEQDVTEAYNTIVDRSVFLPPEEYRDVVTSVTDLRQKMVKEQEYATELRNRLDREPSGPQPSTSPKP